MFRIIKSLLRIGVIVAFGALLFYFIIVPIIVAIQAKKTYPADAIVVLGATEQTMAARRALVGLDLYQKNDAPTIVLSGGGKIASSTVTDFMQAIIKKNTTKKPVFLLEKQSQTMGESLLNTKTLLGGKLQSIIIVSDKFEIARAYIIAKKVGFSSVQLAFPDGQYLPFWSRVYYSIRDFWLTTKVLVGLIFGY